MKQIAIRGLGVVLLVFGLIGLIIPILPGLPLLIIAALCLSVEAPGLRRRLRSIPLWQRLSRFVERRFRGLRDTSKLRIWQGARKVVRVLDPNGR